MSIFIAKHRATLLHYFLRVVDKQGSFDMPLSEAIPCVNSFTTVKGQRQFVDAVDKISCPLFVAKTRNRQPERIMTPDQCIDSLKNDFLPTDARLLSREMYFAVPKFLKTNNSLNSAAAVYDAYRCDLAHMLSENDNAQILIEPVEDFIFLKNIICVAANLLANLSNGGCTMEKSGFFQPEETVFKKPIFVIPFKFQSATYALNFADDFIEASYLADKDTDYLFSLYLQSNDKKVETKQTGQDCLPIITKAIGGYEDVFFSTGFDAQKSGTKLKEVFFAKNSLSGRNLYLCVEGDSDQTLAAKKTIRALCRATEQLTDESGNPLGKEILNIDSVFGNTEQGSKKYTSPSLVCTLWDTTLFHKEYRLTSCQNCGCAVFGSVRGPMRKYCSHNCYVQKKKLKS